MLLDRESASSAEGSALLLAQAFGATLVGERSGGYFEYGELTPFVLPRTGLVIELPTKRFYPAERIEGVGLPVDVYLPPELMKRPARALLPILRQLPERGKTRAR